VLHAFKSPFTGLFVGSIAMILITLICYYSEKPWATITKSLLVVLVIKMLVSPHSMISAYIAVSFQAILGGLLYAAFGVNYVTTTILTTLGLVESACQKIISLTILYGKSIWEAIDSLGNWIAKNLNHLLPFKTSEMLILSYITFYTLVGLILGYFIFRLIRKIKTIDSITSFQVIIEKGTFNQKKKKRKRLLRFLTMVFILAILIIGILYFFGEQNSSFGNAAYILGRTIIILFIWYVLLAPILLKYVKKYLENKKIGISKDVDQAFDLLPYMQSIVSRSWKETEGLSFYKKIKQFVFLVLMYSLHSKIPEV